MRNVEQLLIEYLTGKGLDVYADIPASRPERFVTVERTGGAIGDIILDNATLAVQAWAPTRYEASELAMDIADYMDAMPDSADYVTDAYVTNIYNHPDTQARAARYQLVVILTIQEN